VSAHLLAHIHALGHQGHVFVLKGHQAAHGTGDDGHCNDVHFGGVHRSHDLEGGVLSLVHAFHQFVVPLHLFFVVLQLFGGQSRQIHRLDLVHFCDVGLHLVFVGLHGFESLGDFFLLSGQDFGHFFVGRVDVVPVLDDHGVSSDSEGLDEDEYQVEFASLNQQCEGQERVEHEVEWLDRDPHPLQHGHQPRRVLFARRIQVPLVHFLQLASHQPRFVF